MNIIVKPSTGSRFKDPFDQSDRDPFNGGKGDRNRSNSRIFADNFPASMGQNVGILARRAEKKKQNKASVPPPSPDLNPVTPNS